MAQTLNTDQQDNRDTQKHNNQQKSEDSKINPFRLGKSMNRASIKKQSTSQQSGECTLPITTTTTTSTPLLNQRTQPSKIFLAKCRAELDALLIAIKDTYHQEIKNLYNEQLHADFFILFNQEEFKKPLHRCVVASRAFKLYRSLKAFKHVQAPVEQDIIIREFQEKLALEQEKETSQENIEHSKSEEADQSSSENQPEEQEEEEEAKEVKEDPVLLCDLPHELISPDLFLNFFRRVYLDQDISEEETTLNKRLIDWLKENKPQLIKTPKRIAPDHKESFRTIRPDFDETIVPALLKSPSSTRTNMSPEQLINLDEDDNNTVDETSQSASIRDVSLTGSLLTRTETFELLTKSGTDGKPSRNILIDQNDERSSEASADTSNLDSSNEQPSAEAYAPTTRTGLKPKTFTTPVGLRSSNRGTPGSSGNKPTPSKRDDSKVKSSTPKSTTPKQSSNNTAKRTELSSDSQATPLATKTATPTNQRTTKTIATSTPKTKPTMITRAQPISMERSESPGTGLIKPVRNFIAANKRLISQIEKKNPIIQQNDLSAASNAEEIKPEVDSILEPVFLLESLTSDNLVAQMDKFTLMSQSKLADSLSRMFIDGLLTDTLILVREENKQIMGHKCILAARSAYLAEVIAKQSLPSTNSSSSCGTNEPVKVDLSEFSYHTVYFSMLHIYSGIVKVPEDLDIEELTKITHHLHVSTLTQVCLQNLRMNYCHFFHKPCNVCCVGVLKTLPLAWRYDYTELYSKCLQWIGSNFASIFCLKEFSELNPHDLLEECYSATLSQLTADNIIPKTIECQKLLKNLPRVKWTELIICMVGRLLEDFCHYVAENYEKILQSESFMNLGKNCWECEVLEENLLAAMNHLRPDSGCRTLIQLHKIECSLESYCEDPRNASDSFVNLVSKMRKYCERYLLKEATAVVHCSSWRHMSPSLQKRIKDQAILATDFDEPTKQLASKPRLPSMSRTIASPSGGGSENRSPRSTPDSKLKSPSTTLLPPPKNKTAAARHVKVLK